MTAIIMDQVLMIKCPIHYNIHVARLNQRIDMKTIILACFLSAGIAGAHAQTNNTGTTPNQKKSSEPIKPENNSTPANPNNNGTANDGVIKNGSQDKNPNDTSRRPNPITNPEYQTDPRNENESPNKPDPSGKTTTPENKKSTTPGTTTTPTDRKSKPMVK